MKNVKLISLALSMLISFVAKAQEKTTTKDTLQSILTNKKIIICAPSRPLLNEPLTILDGIVIDAKQFSKLNPNDIESIQVLKANDATAFYGEKAIHGAIVIRSKNKD